MEARAWLRRAGAMLLVATTLLGLAAAAGPAFVASVGAEVLEDELGSPRGGAAVLRVQASGHPGVEELSEAFDRVSAAAAEHDLPEPELGLSVGLETEGGERVVALGRPDGPDQLPDVVEPETGQLAMTDDAAEELGVEPGGELAVVDGGSEHRITVGPLVAPFDHDTIAATWLPVSALLIPPEDPREEPPPPALLGDPDDIMTLLGELDSVGGEPSTAPPVTVSWIVPVPRPVSLERAEELDAAASSLTGDIAAGRGELGEAVATLTTSSPQVGGDLDAVLDRTRAAVTALETPVRALTVAASLLGLVAVAVAVVAGGGRHLDRARLWALRGVAPLTLGVRSGLFAVLPSVVGLALGGALGVVLIERWLGGVVGASRLREIMVALGVLGVCAVLVVTIVIAATAARRARDRPPRTGPPLVELVLVLAAGLAYQRLRGQGGGVEVDAGGVVHLDLLAVGAPLLLVLAGAAVAARLLRVALRGVARLWTRRPLGYLASRRLRSIGGTRLLLTSVVTAALGLLVFAISLAASSEATVEEKVRTVLGAGTVMELPRSEASRQELDPARIEEPTTQVSWLDDARLDGVGEVRLMAVDPARLPRIAHVPAGVEPARFAELVGALEHDDEDGPTPALLVGARTAGVSTISADPLELDVEPVGRLPRFPGADEQLPIVVVADDAVGETGDAALDARLATQLGSELWIDSDRPADELRGQLLGESPGAQDPEFWGEAGFETTGVREGVRAPGLATVARTFGFLQAQAAVVALVAVVLVGLHHVLRRRDQALGEVLSARMGASSPLRRLVDLVELGAMLLSSAVVAAVVGLATARAVLPDYDPIPATELPVVFVVPIGALLMVAGLLVAVVLASALVGARSIARVDVTAVLRGER